MATIPQVSSIWNTQQSNSSKLGKKSGNQKVEPNDFNYQQLLVPQLPANRSARL